MRVGGFFLLSCLAVIHNLWISPGEGLSGPLGFGAVALVYASSSWLLLQRLPSGKRLDLASDVLSGFDIVLWTVAIHVTGGPGSWLFMLMFLRSADHVTMGFRRVQVYGCLSVACYLAMLLWTRFGVGAPVDWAVEGSKAVLIQAINSYIAMTAKQVDSLNQRVKQTQKELRQAKDAAEGASRAKSEFLANMSHELRTPLNAVIGYSQLIREGDPASTVAESADDLKSIERAGTHLLQLVNQVLDFSKIESGRMEVFTEKFDPAGVVREVAEAVRPLAMERSNRLVVECVNSPAEIQSDIMKFRQSLMNLMNNACKFTQGGEVRVRVSADSSTGEDWLVVAVADTGIGIDPKNLSRLFNAFSQADASVSRRYGGTGLGLALARRFSQMMGGDIEVESEPNRGSTFTLRLPLVAAGPEPPGPRDTPS